MDSRDVRAFLAGQFGFLAKSSGEMLWAHHYGVWSVVKKLASYLPRFQKDPDGLELLELAALVHDIGKMRSTWQAAIREGKTLPPHKANDEEIAEYLGKHLPEHKVTPQLVKAVTDIARPHHGPSEKDLAEIDVSGAGFYTQLLTAGDWLASMESINGRVVGEFAHLFEAFCQITYAEVSRFPSPTTYILLNVLDESYRKSGYQPILFTKSGAVFVGPTTAQPPNPEEVVEKAVVQIIEVSLSYQQIRPTTFGDLLGGISAMRPESFLRVKKDELIELLKDVDGGPNLFLMLLKDILKNTGRLEEMRREMDFAAFARESLIRYCDYKATSNIGKGSCERCGCPVAIKPEKGMGFPAGLMKAFSQVKSKPDADRATCVFCAFDNMALRQNMGTGWAPMMLRIDNHIPDLAQHFEALKNFAIRVTSATRNPKDLKWGHEEALPFPIPKRLRVPLGGPAKEAVQEVVPMGERGVYFKLGAGKRDMSVKDQRARFRPLYHLLGLLGFRVAIGEEEQDGLFGLAEVPSLETYNRSLAVLLLASWVKKKERKYLSAEKLLEQRPSVALMTVADQIANRRGATPSPQVEAFFHALAGAELVIAIDQTGKEYMMGELLKDAARLASRESGIQKFCEWPEGGWMQSKYVAGKPIGQALGEIMRGRGVDHALATFQRNLRDTVKKEDEDSLKSLVAYVKALLMRYEELRKSNITEFLRAKNALMSAIYTYTRYPKLTEVIEHGN